MKLSEEHEQFRKAVRQVVENDINPHVDQWEDAKIFPAKQVFTKLAQIGALGLEYDPEFGGQGADHSYTLVLGEELGRIDCAGVPMAIAVQVGMATPGAGPLRNLGAEEGLPGTRDARRDGRGDRSQRTRRRFRRRGNPDQGRP